MSLRSPDGSVSATFEGGEFRMGGPMVGTVTLSTGLRLDDCGEEMVFSDDSRYLAVAAWATQDVLEAGQPKVRLRQRILVADVRTGRVARWPGEFEALRLTRFSGGVVEAVEAPLYEARGFRLSAALP
jgi:hypothetical protein